MIQDFEKVLEKLLARAFPEPVPNKDWVRFQPPNEDWQQYVVNLQHPALNVYLLDIREDRKLRTNERVRTFVGNVAVDKRAPQRLIFHYLISAWHHAKPSEPFDPTQDEHALLYRAAALLLNSLPFVPQEIFAPDSLPPGFPAEIAKAELPMTISPPEGFPKYAEFWGTMGQARPWKPCLYLTVTLPVLLTDQVAGPMVTTRITEYRQYGRPETAEVWIQIGGELTGVPDNTHAWVGIETQTSDPVDDTTTDLQGRFTFNRLAAGAYRLRARPAGEPEITRDIQVPSETGEYDLAP